jgi:hypothetical protein
VFGSDVRRQVSEYLITFDREGYRSQTELKVASNIRPCKCDRM